MARIFRPLFCVAFVAALLAGAAVTPKPAQAAGPRWILGYYPIYQRSLMPIAEIEWAHMTHIVVGRAVPKADGTLDTTMDWDATNGPKFAKDLATAAKAKGVTPILMIGGAGAQAAFKAAATKSSFATNLINTMKNLGFKGLDIDWEPIDDVDQTPLLNLMTKLRSQAPAGTVLTVPVNWTNKNFATMPAFYGQLAKQVDRISLMTYGMAQTWDGWKSWHSSAVKGATTNTPSSLEVSVQSYLNAGVPAAKLAAGVGFYGMCWKGITGPGQALTNATLVADDNVMSFTNIGKLYPARGSYKYDSVAQAPYLSFSKPTGPQGCTFISYENAQSIKAKGQYAIQKGLGGAIVWTINQAHNTSAPIGSRDVLLKHTRAAFGA